MLQFLTLKLLYRSISIILKIGNYEKFETVTLIEDKKNPMKVYIDYQESLSTQTEYKLNT